jgi:hypothetical protein
MKSKFAKYILTLSILSSSCMVNATMIELYSDADSFIYNRDANQDTNYGGATELIVKNDNPDATGWHRQSYVRFDLSSILGSINNATFGLTILSNTVTNDDAGIPNVWDLEIYGLADGAAGNNWGEMDISWNNAPGNDLLSSQFNTDFQYLGSVSLENMALGSVVSFSDLALNNFLSSDTDNMVTLGLRRSNILKTGPGFSFASKETPNSSAPFLNVVAPTLSVIDIPEPTSITILALCLMGLTSRRFNK